MSNIAFMTIHEAYQKLLLQLFDVYDDREAANISDMVIEYVTGQKKIDRIVNKDLPVSKTQHEQLDALAKKLVLHTPVQYVLGEAWFAGLKFYVNEDVLIPRPETEELVEWVVQTHKQDPSLKNLIDIGTGSGCIPISIKGRLPYLHVAGIDVSEGALKVAQKNAFDLKSDVDFKRLDFLDETQWKSLEKFDIIVSNPPYVKVSESESMAANVLKYEPHLALFVPDEDALLFYRKIAEFGKTHLNEQGVIFLEINEQLGAEVHHLYVQEGYDVEIRKDMQGKDRMVKATRKDH